MKINYITSIPRPAPSLKTAMNNTRNTRPASCWATEKSKIISSTRLTEFTDQYKYVNRFLPVWKVSFDDDRKMDVYVETGQSRFATFNDSGRKAFIWIFGTFHNWDLWT
ncbi:hypothetical protein PEC18_10145 [Paucibacter sp. O1-1]|nr:hypothetical protein [Paucibacter sp. O1-1]MDA3826202.1 hypothetical protein [Paucibacter sp. O1-1]